MKEYVCPNCKQKTHIQDDKKYHDCENCGYEFKIDDEKPLYEQNKPKEGSSIFAQALKKMEKKKGENND